jgi:hypothetical protein
MKKIEQYIQERSENPSSEIPNDYKFLDEIIESCSDFKPLLYNIWNQQSYDSNTYRQISDPRRKLFCWA